ncbi:Annexin A7 [Holothuria leucospilota]|uniref:Annexin n=1 Tax=Holothuria leucospilota TaxID=206669 RepID=A0A9Q1BTT4_HOLLE|nr:Annexin A7 [Holothuria leucospilota]
MPSAGAVSAPSIIPLRLPKVGSSANQIDTNTLIELKSETPSAVIYFTSNGQKPDPFVKNSKSTIKYKGPFLLNEGKRCIKAIAISRDGRRESMVVSKTFLVEWAPPEGVNDNDDDDQSFIMEERRPRSSLRRSFADVEDVIDATRSSQSLALANTYPSLRSSVPSMPYSAWGQQPPLRTMQASPDYMFHYHMHEGKPGPRPQPQIQTMQAPVTVNPIGNYGDQNGWGAVHVPLPAFLNQSIGTQTVGLFYPTHEQLTRKEKDVEEVRMLRESGTSMKEKPKLTDASPGKGYWKRQLAHICAHLEAFTQKDSEFRAEVGAPKMGKITAAAVEDDGVDVTITLSFESKAETAPSVRPNRASVARQGAISMKQMAKESEADAVYGKRKKKPLTKKLAAKKKEEEKLTAEEKALFKEIGPRGEGNPDTVQDLLDEGADPNSENKDGIPALMMATINNHLDAAEVLMEEGATISTKASARKGNTALHEAVLLGPDGQEIIELLLENNASPKTKNTKGETPYDLAVKNGYQSIVALFASSMGQDMLDKMSNSKKGKGKTAKKKKEESEEEEAEEEEESDEDSPRPKKYKEKLPKDKGTVYPASNHDPQADAEKLRKAMKGFGTDEKAIIEVLSQRSNFQRQKICKQFKQMFGKDLVKELKGELSGKLWDVVEGLLMTPEVYDAHQLHKAIKGLGTDEDCLIEIICTRTNSSIKAIKKAYQQAFSKKLEDDISGDTSGNFQRLLVSILEGARPEDDEVDPGKAKEDANALYKAGEDKWGTDESRFNVILMSRSYAQLRATFEEYTNVSKHTIEQAIKKEMSGDVKNAMLAVVRCVMNKHKFFADRLYKTMKGLGTDDETLKRIVISRCEVDMENIKGEYQAAYKETLGKAIAGDTSGDYKKILVALVGGEN